MNLTVLLIKDFFLANISLIDRFLKYPYVLINKSNHYELDQKGFIKITKKVLVSYLIIFIAFSGTGLFFLFNPFTKSAEAAWFNDNWGYRQRIDVTVATDSSDRTNVDLYLTVDTTGITANLQANCEDLRFTNTNGDVLPYYIQTCTDNSATNKIWVRANLIPKNTTTFTMYMYYGNPSATAGSNASLFNLQNNLQAYYPMNESSWTNNCSTGTVSDLSGNGFNARACPNSTGPTTPAAAKFGNGANLDGTNDYLEYPDTATLDITSTDSFTISAWVNADDFGANYSIGSKKTSATTASSAGYSTMLFADGSFCGYVSDGTTQYSTCSALGGISATTWYHVVFLFDRNNPGLSGTYVNSVRDVSSENISSPENVGNASNALAFQVGAVAVASPFDGKIDDFRLYKRALSPSEITQLYSTYGTISVTTSFASEEKGPSPAAYWKFDDAQGSTAQDSTSNNNDVTLAASTANPTWSANDVCISGSCLKFDGSNDYANTSASLDLSNTAAITVEFWMNWGMYATDDDLAMEFSTNANSSTTGFYIDPNESGAGTFRVYLKGDVGANSVEFTRPSPGWHHFAFVLDKSQSGDNEITPYIDGMAVTYTKTSNSNNTNNFGSNTLYLMSRAGSSLFGSGLMDEVKIYPFAKTSAQVQSAYNSIADSDSVSVQLSNSGFSANPGSLFNGITHYWPMDEASWTVDCSTPTVTDTAGAATLTSCPNSTGPQTTAAGKFGRAGSFDGGSSDIIQYDYNMSSESYGKRWGVSMWFKTSDTQGYLIDTRGTSDSGANGIAVFTDGANTFSFYQAIGGTNTTYNNYTSSTLDNAWHHLVITRDGDNSISFYIDGTKLTATPQISNADLTSLSEIWKTFSFGNRHVAGTYPLTGTLDDIRIFNRGLAQNDVTGIYNYGPEPVGYWRLDEKSGSTAYDVSSNGNNGTLGSTTAAPSWTNGKYGGALSYDGGDTVSVSDSNSLSLTNAFSLAAWVRVPNVSGYKSVVTKENAGQTGYFLYILDDEVYTGYGDGAWRSQTTSTSPITANTWIHIASTFDGTTLTTYVNGVSVQTSTPGGSVSDNASDLGIGNAADLSSMFTGLIDEAKVYNYPRTAGQIVADMNAGHPAPGSPVGTPIGHWKFDEGYGTTANNSGSTGSLLPGTLTNMDSPATSTSGWANDGKFNKALSFNGDSSSGDYVSIPYNAVLDITTDITMTAWIKKAMDDDYGGIISKTNGSTLWDYDFFICDSDCTAGANYLAFYSDSTSPTEIFSNRTITGTDWHHVAVTRSGSTVTFYIDGLPAGGGTLSGNFAANSLTLRIGTDGTGSSVAQFNGKIDEPKLYNQALTVEQIKIDMNRGQAQVMGAVSTSSTAGNDNASTRTAQSSASEYCIPGDSSTCTSPVGRWDFEEGSGAYAYDTSGNGNTADIIAGTSGAYYPNGKIGKAYSFDAASTHVFAGSGTSLDNLGVSDGMTLEAWIYPKSRGENNNAFIITKNSGASQANGGWLFLLNGISGSTVGLQFVVDGTTDLVRGTDATAVTLNQWNHVVLIWDGVMTTASSARIFVNGREATYSTTTNGATRPDDGASSLYIGNASSLNRTFDGYIDQVRVFNYDRSIAQIIYDYNRGAPIAHWKMDECQGATINDSSGNSYSGTLTVGGTVGTCQTSSTSWGNGVTGKRNYSIDLNGSSDYIQVTDTANLRFDGAAYDFSLFAWVKRDSNGEMNIISKEDADNDGYRLQFTSGNAVRCSVDAIDIDSTRTITDTSWHLVGCTIDRDGNGQIYIDGQSNGTATAISSEVMATTSNIRLGTRSYTSTNYLDGLLDDTRIYNYALTADQVKNLYNQGAANYGPVTGAP